MKRFLLHTAGTLFLAGVLLEVVLRVFHLASHVPPEADVNGDRLYLPGARGTWVYGGLGEIRGRYVINAQGWNSTVDYEEEAIAPAGASTGTTTVRVAIIGDSFIEGMHVDADSSVGRIMESLSPDYIVNEYGKAGANVADYALIYKKYVEGRYDHVFVLVSDDDLVQELSGFMNRGQEVRAPSLAMKVYRNCHVLRYFRLNHKLGARLRGRRQEKAATDLPATSFLGQVNHDALDILDNHVIYLYRTGKLNSVFVASRPCLEIRQDLQPYDFGFDGHWNMNGRWNCAMSIYRYIQEGSGYHRSRIPDPGSGKQLRK
jgi:hypothetical protein